MTPWNKPARCKMGYVKTAILMAAMTALFTGIGYLLGGAGGAMIALVAAAAMNVVTWWNSDKLVLRMHGAEPVTRGDRMGLHAIEPPHLSWSTVMFRGWRTRNGEQAAQARGNSSEAAAG